MVVKRKAGAGPKKAVKKPAGAHNPFEFRKNKERAAVLGKMKPTNAPTGHARAHAFEIVCPSFPNNPHSTSTITSLHTILFHCPLILFILLLLSHLSY